jgi:predicted RNA-binding Zn ribbon-like protein
MASKYPATIELVMREWLGERSYLFSAIFDQVALELAPIVAEQVVADLKERLFGKLTRDELLDQIDQLLADLQRWHESDQYDEGLKLEDAEHSLCSRIRHVRNLVFHDRNAQRAGSLAQADAELPAGDVVEGGGA